MAVKAAISVDPVLAERAMSAVEKLADAAVSERFAVVACQSAFTKVRADAVRILMRASRSASRDSLLKSACFDRGPGVRALAFSALDGADRICTCDLARIRLESAEVASGLRVAALHILALAQTPELPTLALDHVNATSPSLRAAAWTCRWQALKRPAIDELERVLVDMSSTVRRVGLKQIQAGVPAPAPEWLRSVGLERPYCIGTVMSALQHASRWERIRFLLSALSLPDQADAVRSRLMAEVQDWGRSMVNCYVRPTSDQADAIRASWLHRPDAESSRPYLDRIVAEHFRAFGIV